MGGFVVHELSAFPLVPWQVFLVERVAKHQDPQLYNSPVLGFSLSKPFKMLILRIRAPMLNLSGPGTTQTSQWVKGCCLCFKRGTWWPSGRSLENGHACHCYKATAMWCSHHWPSFDELREQRYLADRSSYTSRNFLHEVTKSEAFQSQQGSVLAKLSSTHAPNTEKHANGFCFTPGKSLHFFCIFKMNYFSTIQRLEKGSNYKIMSYIYIYRTCYSISVELQIEMCK